MTYFVAGMAASMLHARQVQCSADEVSTFSPPSGQTCQQYMAPYLQAAPGYLLNPQSTTECNYCSISNADTFLAGSGIEWSQRWRNFGIMWAYVAFNTAAAVFLYYFFRVRSGNKRSSAGKSKSKKGKKGEQKDEENQNENREPIAAGTSDEEKDDSDGGELTPRRSGVAQTGWNNAQQAAEGYFSRNLKRSQTNRANAAVF